MRLRVVVSAVLIGAGLLLPVQPLAQAKTSYKYKKFKKYKARKFKGSKKIRGMKVGKHKTVRHA
jgi:hypothetical protein